MKVGAAHLGYCTNVHAAESLEDVVRVLESDVVAVRDRASSAAPFGVGLRLSARAARELGSERSLERFRETLARLGLYVFTLNGFVYGDFHGDSVKDRAYTPDWRTAERVAYCRDLAAVLAAIVPEGTRGSISTVPGAYRAHVGTDEEIGPMVAHIADVVADLVRIHQETGTCIRLAFEPEPLCLLETTAELVGFFEEHLLRAGVERLGGLLGVTRPRAELAMRTFAGACVDACHLAVEFEDPRASIDLLARAGVAIAKVQLSSGLEVLPRRGEASALFEALAPFSRDRYLHQVVEERQGALVRWPDLPDALANAALMGMPEAWRIHYHVPIYRAEMGPFGSTQRELIELIEATKASGDVDHYEVETYTWSVLGPEHRNEPLPRALARELAWARERLEAR